MHILKRLCKDTIVTKFTRSIMSTNAHKKKVFIGWPLIKPALDIIENAGFIDATVWPNKVSPTEEEWITNVKGMHGLYSFGPQKINAKILDAAGSQLEVVSIMSVGVDSIELGELKKRGIKLGNTPDVLTDSVAEYAIGLLLGTSRRILETAESAKIGGWSTWDPFSGLGVGLKNSTVGIVGLGRIGTGVAKRLIPFGVERILYHSRSEKPTAAKEVNAIYVSFDQLLQESDYVIICCSMNESSKELFNKSAFAKMKKNGILINIGRGGMINQDDLVEALKSNKIKAAGLDVTSPEPLPSSHPLFSLPNCFITPHIASADKQTRTDMATLAARNLVAALKGEKMPAEYSL